MPIASLVVRATLDMVDEVAQKIDEINGVTVTYVDGEKLVVLTETNSRDEDLETWEVIKGLNGVINLDLIYYNYEEV